VFYFSIIYLIMNIFDIIITYFLNSHFSFYPCYKHIITISKVHYEFTFSHTLFIFKNVIPIELYDNVDNLNFDNINVKYAFTFSIHV
jgi:hypothetical protein